jgi:hypothetical protein
MLMLPGIPLWFMAFGVGLMTPVPYPIAYALIGGLSADSVVKHPAALQIFPEVKLIDFDSAAKDALEKTHPAHIERIWDDGRTVVKSIKHEGCFIDHREMTSRCKTEQIVRTLLELGEKRNWVMEVDEALGQVVACMPRQITGRKWIEWRVGHVSNVTYISQTIFFCPRGLPGFLYWYFLYPIHLMSFSGLIKRISQESNTH